MTVEVNEDGLRVCIVEPSLMKQYLGSGDQRVDFRESKDSIASTQTSVSVAQDTSKVFGDLRYMDIHQQYLHINANSNRVYKRAIYYHNLRA